MLGIYNECWPDRKNISRMIKLDRHRGIVVEKANTRQTEAILDEYELPFRKKVFGNYILYYFVPEAEKEEGFLNNQNSLYWIGIGICRINLKGFGKLLMDSADNPYTKVLRYFPTNPYLRNKLLQIYKEKGEYNLFEREKLFIRNRFVPGIKYFARFNGGIEFLGLGVRRLSEELLRMDYFWRLEEYPVEKIFVFVHFVKDGKIVFQNDHPLLGQFIRFPVMIPDEIWKESYMVRIPKADYKLRIGLWVPAKGKRIKMEWHEKDFIEVDSGEI